MTAFDRVLTDIFDRRADKGRLPLAEERAAIAEAKAGDGDALVKLMYAYAYSLRTAVAWYTRALPTVEQRTGAEDARMEAVSGFMEAIHAFDPDKYDRLAAIAYKKIEEAVASSAWTVTGFTVPTRSLTRFFGILRQADGNVYEAASIAPQFDMKRETFLAILSAVRDVDGLDSLQPVGEDDGASYELQAEAISGVVRTAEEVVEDAILVEAAFAAVDDLETDVVRLAYGFADYDPQPDAEIGHRLGLSRPKTQRVRSSALGKMRTALGVA
jgi:DNA-directed RNA polymerase specialized sigma subunit